MYQFPGATVTKCPRPSGFKQQELVLSWLSRPEVRSRGVGGAVLFLTALRENAPWPFQLLEVAAIPGFLGLQPHHSILCLRHHVAFSSLWPLSVFFSRKLSGHIGSGAHPIPA